MSVAEKSSTIDAVRSLVGYPKLSFRELGTWFEESWKTAAERSEANKAKATEARAKAEAAEARVKEAEANAEAAEARVKEAEEGVARAKAGPKAKATAKRATTAGKKTPRKKA